AHHVALRQQVVHDRERALLGFTGVRRSTDQDEALAEVHQNERWRSNAVALRIGLETRKVDDREFGLAWLSCTAIADEHRAREQRVPCELIYDSHRQAIIRIGSDKR